MVNRLSEPLAEEMNRQERELLYLARRLGYIRSVHEELVRVAQGRLFNICHKPTWRMLLSERDMIVIDMASWVRGLYSKGGFLRKLQGDDLRALSRRDQSGSELESSRAAYARLFPRAAQHFPTQQDIDVLVAIVSRKFDPLLDDRDIYRAHKHERQRRASAAMLAPGGVADYVKLAIETIADIRLLCSGSYSPDLGLELEPSEDVMAHDAVDLVLVGTLRWLVYLLPPIGDSDMARLDAYNKWRDAHYRLLHKVHDASGSPDDPFNADDLTVSTQLRAMIAAGRELP